MFKVLNAFPRVLPTNRPASAAQAAFQVRLLFALDSQLALDGMQTKFLVTSCPCDCLCLVASAHVFTYVLICTMGRKDCS
jgi:hypothetical protein